VRKTLFAVICLFLAVPCPGRIITVDCNGPADFNNIQAAINDANDDDTVVVLPGTYTGPGNRDIDFLGKAITVRSNDPNDRDIVAATIIDCNASWSDSHRGFVFDSNEEPNSVLSGMTITRGNFRYIEGKGGAVYCDRASPTISKCRLINNEAAYGGAIACIESNASISDSLIKGNYTDGCGSNGGGIYLMSGNVLIERCVITENISGDRQGGGILCNRSNCTVAQCLIFGNKCGEQGGGVGCIFDSNVVINACTMADNQAYGGGGINVESSCATVTNSVLWGNKAGYGNQIALRGNFSTKGEITLGYCDIEGLHGDVYIDWEGQLNLLTGNIDEYPKFVQQGRWDDNGTPDWPRDDLFLGGGDYHVLSNSPCISAGDPNYAAQQNERDLDGTPRIVGPRIDMGAYEFHYQLPYMELSKQALCFGTFTPDFSPADQSLQIINFGLTSFTWRIDEDCPWLQVLPASGEVATNEVNQVMLQVDPNGLGCGRYNCELTVSSPEAMNSPETVEVWFYLRVEPNALTVPDPYPTIQDAIDDANDGDTIIVAPGTYNENINFKGKNAVLTSVDPSAWLVVGETIIQGDGTASVVTFASTEDANCTLSGFTVTGGDNTQHGGGIFGNGCLAAIQNCIVTGNRAAQFGGGMGGGLSQCHGPITRCIISYNSAGDSLNLHGYGGGLEYCNGPITHCTITYNWAFEVGGGLEHCNGPITNCIISNNSSYGPSLGYGGGLDHCSGPITNCTIVDNRAGSSGGGLGYCSAVITNCIIWANSPDNLYQSAQPAYSCFTEATAGLGNISADPCFANPNNGDYHLKSEGWYWDADANQWNWTDVTSRCIDAGNPGSLLGHEAITLDVDLLNRFGQNLRINMGAYGGTAEASMPPYDWALLADLTNDGTVDFDDLMYWTENWPASGSELPGDLDRNGRVEALDFALFALDWLLETSWHQP
jgi:hypothetical protein